MRPVETWIQPVVLRGVAANIESARHSKICADCDHAGPKRIAISGPAVSKHLRVLERAGLISRGRDAQWRPCRLEAAPLREVADWAEGYRRHWDANYERLDAYLETLEAKEER